MVYLESLPSPLFSSVSESEPYTNTTLMTSFNSLKCRSFILNVQPKRWPISCPSSSPHNCLSPSGNVSHFVLFPSGSLLLHSGPLSLPCSVPSLINLQFQCPVFLLEQLRHLRISRIAFWWLPATIPDPNPVWIP